MNYRHHFHAGNFADVMKHALLVQLMGGLQRKPTGFLYLDTHAGRGRYDLETAASGDSLARKPEWPDGIGRLWSLAPDQLPASVAEYVDLVRRFDRDSGNLEKSLRFYPGSPWIGRMLARSVDRLALYEKHLDDFLSLYADLSREPKTSVHESDGYGALRAMLPPPERRALVLIDPPYEAADESEQIVRALGEGLQRMPSGVFAVWYPLTTRARADEFLGRVRMLRPPPTIAGELTIAGEYSPIKMRGCGLLVINPPWQFEKEATPILEFLARTLAQEPGAEARIEWIVPES
jgi:23S rRNA (adenine2030-N6)-methyltransferase